MVINKQEETIKIPMRSFLPVILTLILGVTISVILFVVVRNWEKSNLQIEFESRSRGYESAILNRLHGYLEALKFTGDFYNNSELITRKEFSEYTSSVLSRYPGIQAFSWNPLVLDKDRDKLESLTREEGFEDFQIVEKNKNGKLERAARREEYVVVYHINPMKSNKAAFGYDIASNPTRLRAIKQAFYSGEITATDRITLVQETEQQYGALILLPIYKKNKIIQTAEQRYQHRKGLLVEVLRIGDVMKTALASFPDEGIDIHLHDLSSSSSGRRLFFRPSKVGKAILSHDEANRTFALYRSVQLEFAGRKWEIVFTISGENARNSNLQSWIILIGSLLLTFLLSFYLLRKLNLTVEIEQRIQQQVQTNTKLENEIVERKRAEEELHESEAQLRLITDNIPAMIAYVDKEMIYHFVNHEYCKAHGLDRNDIIGKNVEDILEAKSFEQLEPYFQEVLSGNLVQFETPMNLYGRKQYVNAVYVPHFAGSQADGFFALVQDVTARKELEAQLQQAQKMEALGTLAGGIAHDFNNILASMLGNAEMLRRRLPLKDTSSKHLEKILSAGKRASELIQRILMFSRMEKNMAFKPLNLATVVEEALEVMRATIPANINIRKNLIKECPNTMGDSTQIHQVIFNLCVNAWHAMEEEGGTLTITLQIKSGCHIDDCVGDGTCLNLIITDTGSGISQEDLKQIFDPFFTTKEVGQGTGLGLSVVHGIMESHKGKITVESKKEVGTTVELFFPITEHDEIKEVFSQSVIPKGSWNILIVEDEEDIIELYKDFFEDQGYSVATCHNGKEALEILRSDSDKFDLIITDQAMPILTGKQLIQEVQHICPNLPIVLTTGYSGVEFPQKIKISNNCRYLMKPVELTKLQQVIEEVMQKEKKPG